MELTDRDMERARRGGKNRPASDFAERVLCPGCNKVKILTTDYVCARCLLLVHVEPISKLAAKEPRVKNRFVRGVRRGTVCDRCDTAVQWMCRDREQSGRHVLCEIPDEYDLQIEHGLHHVR